MACIILTCIDRAEGFFAGVFAATTFFLFFCAAVAALPGAAANILRAQHIPQSPQKCSRSLSLASSKQPAASREQQAKKSKQPAASSQQRAASSKQQGRNVFLQFVGPCSIAWDSHLPPSLQFFRTEQSFGATCDQHPSTMRYSGQNKISWNSVLQLVCFVCFVCSSQRSW